MDDPFDNPMADEEDSFDNPLSRPSDRKAADSPGRWVKLGGQKLELEVGRKGLSLSSSSGVVEHFFPYAEMRGWSPTETGQALQCYFDDGAVVRLQTDQTAASTEIAAEMQAAALKLRETEGRIKKPQKTGSSAGGTAAAEDVERARLTRLVCYACYAAYMLLGLSMMIVGVTFLWEMGNVRRPAICYDESFDFPIPAAFAPSRDGLPLLRLLSAAIEARSLDSIGLMADLGSFQEHGYISIGLGACGFSLMVIGGLAFFSISKMVWLGLLGVQVANMLFVFLLLLLAIAALFLGLGIRDPVRTAVDSSWTDSAWLQSFWDTGYCAEQVPKYCELALPDAARMAMAQPQSDFLPTATLGQVFADCATAAGQTAMTHAALLLDTCNQCNFVCREALIGEAKQNIAPATVCVIVLLGFVWTAGFYLSCVAYDEAQQTPKLIRIMTYVLNGAASILGLLLMVLSLWGQQQLGQTCSGADCSNMVVSSAAFLGAVIFLVGIVAVWAVFKDVKLLIKATAAMLFATGFMLIIVNILSAIVAGGMETVNSESEKNFPRLRASYERRDPSYCTILDGSDGGAVIPMSDDDCRTKIMGNMQSHFLTISLIGIICVGTMIFTLLTTFKMIKVIGRNAPHGCTKMFIKQSASVVKLSKGVDVKNVKSAPPTKKQEDEFDNPKFDVEDEFDNPLRAS